MEGEGSIPISPLQLEINYITKKRFIELNRKWHSRFPKCGNCWSGIAFGASYNNFFYSVAWWSQPIAANRLKNGFKMLELRRLANSPEAPKNTSSRFLSVMVKIIKKDMPNIYKLISYQDTDVHIGTIYKASGWIPVETQKKGFQSWKNRPNRTDQSEAIKIRWEKQIRKEPKIEIKKEKKINNQLGLF